MLIHHHGCERLRRRFLRFGETVTVAASILLALPTGALACTQIYMGPGTAESSDTYVGRTENRTPRASKVLGIQEPRTNPTFTSSETVFTWTYTGTTYRYTYLRDSPTTWDGRLDAYAEAGTNGKGVSVSATDTTDANTQIVSKHPGGLDAGTNVGIGEYNIADVVLSCASTAREGVEVLGKVIDENGSYDYNQITISDPSETWRFMMLSGHQ